MAAATVHGVVTRYLEGLGVLGYAPFGESESPQDRAARRRKAPTRSDRDRVAAELRGVARLHHRFFNISAGIVVGLIAATIAAVVVLPEGTVTTLLQVGFGGSAIALLSQLRKTWREVHVALTLAAIIGSLPPREALDALEAYYFSLKSAEEDGPQSDR